MKIFFLIKKLLLIKNSHIFIISSLLLLIALFEIVGLGLFQNTIYMLLNNSNNELSKLSGIVNFLLNLTFKEANLNSAAILFAIIFIIKNIFTTFTNYIILSFFQKKHIFLLQSFFRRLINLDYQYIIENKNTKFNQIFSRYIDNFIKGYTIPIIRIISESFFIIIIISFLIYLDFKVTILTFGCLFFVLVFCIYIISKLLKKNSVVIGKSEENMKSTVYQYINNFKEIFVYKLSDKIFFNFNYDSSRYTKAEKKYAFLITLPRQIFEILIILSLTLILIFVFNKDNLLYNLGIFATITLAIAKLVPALNSIASNIATMRQHTYAIEEIEKFFLDKKLNDLEKIKKNNQTSNNVKIKYFEIKNLNFNYDKKKQIIRNFNLKASKGEIIAIQGPSGSGKTTLIDLILDILKPSGGNIKFYDELDNQIINFNDFSYISQNTTIFSGTLLENIVLNNKNFDKENILNLVKKIGLNKISDNEKILEYQLFEDGKNISGGQKQKISFLRCLAQNKQIILMDEATSNLDIASENIFYDILNSIKKDKIILFVSHKLKNEQFFDKIIKINLNS